MSPRLADVADSEPGGTRDNGVGFWPRGSININPCSPGQLIGQWALETTVPSLCVGRLASAHRQLSTLECGGEPWGSFGGGRAWSMELPRSPCLGLKGSTSPIPAAQSLPRECAGMGVVHMAGLGTGALTSCL